MHELYCQCGISGPHVDENGDFLRLRWQASRCEYGKLGLTAMTLEFFDGFHHRVGAALTLPHPGGEYFQELCTCFDITVPVVRQAMKVRLTGHVFCVIGDRNHGEYYIQRQEWPLFVGSRI